MQVTLLEAGGTSEGLPQHLLQACFGEGSGVPGNTSPARLRKEPVHLCPESHKAQNLLPRKEFRSPQVCLSPDQASFPQGGQG